MTARGVLLTAVVSTSAVGVLLAVVAATSLTGRRPSPRPGPRAAGADTRAPADVRVARTRLGHVLVDRRGLTLYLFTRDRHGRSTCAGACARVWPPAVVGGSPRAGRGVAADRLTATRRRDGRRQLVYDGHPLYAMSADRRPGDTEGQGFLGTWFAVSPEGEPVGGARGGGY